MKKLLIIISLLTTSLAFGKAKIEKLDFQSGDTPKVLISLSESLDTSPELTIKDNIIQLELPNSYVWPKIEKKVTWGSNKFDTTITAYQFNKQLVRFRIILPQDMKDLNSFINVSDKGKTLEIEFPNYKIASAQPVQQEKKNQLDDDAFLNQLIAQSKQNTAEIQKTEVVKSNSDVADKKTIPANKFFEDKVQQKLSGEKKIDKKGFSFNEYLMKFIAFLGLILLGFYAVVILMRKGIVKKGRLGFLNSEKMVEVLSTTYVGPKKNVIMLKAHNQVFLIGTSEKGMHFLSEINDVSGLIKEGERRVSGNNFDTNLVDAEKENKEFNLKSVLTESEGVDGIVQVEDKVSLSDQIKKKVQGLKPLQ